MENQILINLGKAKDGEEITWNPIEEVNPHMILIGGSGSGKTETLKKIVFELKHKDIPSLIFDFHDDFTYLGENIIDCDKIQINPLEIEIGECGLDLVYRFSNIIKNVFGQIGSKQEAALRDAIKSFYEESGIDLKQKNDGTFKVLPFKNFKEKLEHECIKDKTLINKLSILFDFEIFSSDYQKDILPFKSMTERTSVIKLNKFPNDEIKTLVSEILLYKLINFSYKNGKSKLHLFCVIDEAHRLIYDGSPVELMMREARKYGLGLLLASQRQSDFSENIFGNVGVIVTLRTPLPKDVTFISNIISINKNDIAKITNPGRGYIKYSRSNIAKYLEIEPIEHNSDYKKIKETYNEEQAKVKVEKEISLREEEERKKKHYEILLIESKILNKKIEKFEREAEETKHLLELKNTDIKEKELKIFRLDKENEKITKEISNLNAEITLLTNIKKEIQDNLNNLKTEKNSQISDLKKEITNLNKEKDELEGEKQKIEAEAIKLIHKKDTTISNFNEKIESLEKNLSNLEEKESNLKKEISKANSLNNALKKEKDNLIEKNEFMKDKIDFIKNKLTTDVKTKFFVKDIDFNIE